MFMFFRIERPTIATLRPCRDRRPRPPAACGGCSRRSSRRGCGRARTGMIWRNASPTSRSEPVMPGRSAFVESPSSRSTPRLPSSASLPTSVLSPSTGVWSSFQSPVCRTRPAAVSIDDGDRSRGSSAPCGRTRRGTARAASARRRGSASRRSVELPRPCSSSFDLIRPSVRRVADHLADLDLAQHVRQRADVVLVAVREHDRAERPVVEVAEVGQDEVDPEVLVAREREPRVDDDPLLAELEERSCSCRPRRARRAG